MCVFVFKCVNVFIYLFDVAPCLNKGTTELSGHHSTKCSNKDSVHQFGGVCVHMLKK
jgi:hypothetical protein